jgi:hypothetical protein
VRVTSNSCLQEVGGWGGGNVSPGMCNDSSSV